MQTGENQAIPIDGSSTLPRYPTTRNAKHIKEITAQLKAEYPNLFREKTQ